MIHPSVFIHPSAIVEEPCFIGEGTAIWHFVHVMAGAHIGASCVLGQGVFVASDVRIGNACRIQNQVSLYTGVELEDAVFLGPACTFTNVLYPRAELPQKPRFAPTRVSRGASVGANATILCGARIGRYAMIGAGALVRGVVPDYALMTGVPARKRGWAGRHGRPLEPDMGDRAWRCRLSGFRYVEVTAPDGMMSLRCLDLPEDQWLAASGLERQSV